METTTKENTRRLHRKLADKFLPVAESLRGEGLSDHEILVEFGRYRQCEIKKFYRKPPATKIISSIKSVLDNRPDSKVESIFYVSLSESGISFQFQYKIGPYKADFLIDEFLVFEIDGPHHEEKKQREHDIKRDKFMQKLGYKIMRVPAWLLCMDPEAAIDEIKDIIKNNAPQTKN